MEASQRTVTYDVHPSGIDNRYTDAAMMTFFHTHISLAMNSANLVWQRFNIMVVANAIIFSFLSNKNDITVVFGALFGFVLCGCWYTLIASEWGYFLRWMELSKRFHFDTLSEEANPHHSLDIRPIKQGGYAKRISNYVILLFVFAYAFLLIRFCLCKAC
jgi:hypothetical protein